MGTVIKTYNRHLDNKTKIENDGNITISYNVNCVEFTDVENKFRTLHAMIQNQAKLLMFENYNRTSVTGFISNNNNIFTPTTTPSLPINFNFVTDGVVRTMREAEDSENSGDFDVVEDSLASGGYRNDLKNGDQFKLGDSVFQVSVLNDSEESSSLISRENIPLLTMSVSEPDPLDKINLLLEKASENNGDLFFIKGYNIVKELGKGSMGAVYLAEDQRLGGKVAIKRLSKINANRTF